MSRYRASFIHLMISAVLVSLVIATAYFIWYPRPAFQVAGAITITNLLIGVDLILGPALTLVVYKHGKPGLKLDLAIIVFVQLVALVYGAYTLYDERPHYLVFSVDRLEFVAQKQVDQSQIRYDELEAKPVTELIRVFARPPEDPDEFQTFLDSVVIEGRPDLESRPEFWEPWAAGTDVIRSKVRSIDDFAPSSPREQEALRKAKEKYLASHTNLGVLPIGGIDADIGMLIDVDTLDILGVLDVNPW